MPQALGTSQFDQWLKSYGAAWESRDAKAASLLFADDAEYFWTPFEAPKRGPVEISQAWDYATSRQRDIRFSHEILAISGRAGIARWHTVLTRTDSGTKVELDGVLVAEFDASGAHCRVFREWWHSTGPAY